MKISHTVSREEWLAARRDLLAKEKATSRQLAALAEQRRALPAVAIDKDYVFEGPDGRVALIDLFEDRSQLIVYHFMWLHDLDEGCPSCSFAVDNMPDPIHLNDGADTTLALVSRVPYARLSQFKARMGWRLPWYSSTAATSITTSTSATTSRSHPSNTTTRTRPRWCARDWSTWPPTALTGRDQRVRPGWRTGYFTPTRPTVSVLMSC